MFTRGMVFSTTPAEFCMEKIGSSYSWGDTPNPVLLFLITEKDPAGRTLQKG